MYQREIADRATIRVQYDAQGTAVACWVTNDDNVAVNGPTAAINMRHWHDYRFYADQLRIDPNKCSVWSWSGKQ